MKNARRRLQGAVAVSALACFASIAQAATITPVTTVGSLFVNGSADWTNVVVAGGYVPGPGLIPGDRLYNVGPAGPTTAANTSGTANSIGIVFTGDNLPGIYAVAGSNWANGSSNLAGSILWTHGNSGTDTLTLTFATPISSFGANVQAYFLGSEPSAAFTITAQPNIAVGPVSVTSNDGSQRFLGFNSDTLFNSVTISGLNFGVSQAYFFTGQGTQPSGNAPEPGTLLLMGGGLLAIGFKLRNRFRA